MALNVNQKLLALFLLAFLSGSSAQAESVVAGSTALPGTAIMDLLLEPNTPFNPTESPITLSGVSGVGSITINRDAQVGNTINLSSCSLTQPCLSASRQTLTVYPHQTERSS
jgi:hypothetical protein